MIPDQILSRLGDNKGTDTNEVRFCCPFCEGNGKTKDDKYHLYVNSDSGKWICFKCDERGSIERLASLLGISIDPTEEVVDRNELDTIIDEYENLGVSVKVEAENVYEVDTPEWVSHIVKGTDAWSYLLYARKFDKRIIKKYSLMYGNYAGCNRIWIPIHWNDKLVYWMARKYFNDSSKVPKYVNPTEFKKHYVFNLDKVRKDIPVIICEGAFSAIVVDSMLESAGNAVAILGKTATPEQISKLMRANFPEYIVSLDGDARPEAIKLAKSLFDNGLNVSIVDLPNKKDPDELRQSYIGPLYDRYPYSMEVELNV